MDRLIAKSALDQRLVGIVEPILVDMGYELVRIRSGSGKPTTIQIMVDRSEGSMDMKEISEVTGMVGTVLDVEDPISGSYTLEVSSPGIDRPLTRRRDFETYAGHKARIEIDRPVDGRCRFRGVLAGVENDEILVVLDEGTIGLRLDWLSDARLMMSDERVRSVLKNRKASRTADGTGLDETVMEDPEKERH